MARKYDADRARAVEVERLAEKDPVFAVNFRALTANHKYRQLRPTVTSWLMRQAQARERRQMQHQFTPTRVTAQVERELFG
jgi:hypothetical protein